VKRIYILGCSLLGSWILATALTQPPERPPIRPLLLYAQAPPEVVSIFQRSCQNCHSSRTEWPIYSRVFPASLLIARDVQDARAKLDFTAWESYGNEYRRDVLAQIGVVTRNRIMPPSRYLLLHREAKLDAKEVDVIYRWTRSERKRLAEQTSTMRYVGDR
jgi:hypothetical protein